MSYASKHAPKHALKYDIFWTSLRHQQLLLMRGALYGNISSQSLVKGPKKGDEKSTKRLANCWQKKRWPKDG